MTIQINEEGHPLWIKVDEIWEDAKLKESETMKAEEAKAAILGYCREDLGQTQIDKHLEVLEDLWNDIDSQNSGKVTRDAMFNHLKYARDVEIPSEVVEATSPGIKELNAVRRESSFKLGRPLELPEIAKAREESEKQLNTAPTIEEEPFAQVDAKKAEEDAVLDERWKKKMHRASTIAINEDEHPCWEQVDTIWKEYGLTEDQALSTE